MKTIIVLGMHRSATSLVTQGISLAGVNIGRQLLGPGHGNSKGHFENLDFVLLNELILKESGGAWNDPPPEKAILEAGGRLANAIQEVVKRNTRHPLWGWKDPRTTLTIRCYMPYLENPIFNACFRDPEEVAKSLRERDKTPLEDGMALANIYNQRLIGFLDDFTRGGV